MRTWGKGYEKFLLASLLLLSPGASLRATDVWDQASPADDTAANTRNVLVPGDPPQRHDVQAKAGPTADQDWFRLVVVAGHSYEVRVGARQDSCFDFFGNNFQVLGSDGVTLLTTGVDYPGTGVVSSFRATFVAPSNQNVFVQLVGSNPCTATSEYTIQVFDTTLVNPLWSTFGGFETFYRFQNVTNTTISVTLTLINDAGTVVASTTFTVNAGRTVPTRNTGPTDLNLADNQAGQALITHDGPAGGIQVDGFLGLFTGGQSIVLPIKIERGWKGD